MVKDAERDNQRQPHGPLLDAMGPSIPLPEPETVEAQTPPADAGPADEITFEIPPSAQRHIDNAENPHNIAKIDTLEDQMGGRFAAKLSTLGSRAVTGRLPGEKPAAKVEKPKEVKRWEKPVRRYISPRDKGAPPHIAKELRGE